MAGVLQDRLDHVGRGGFAFGAGDADGLQFLGRVAEPGCADACQCVAAVRNFHDCRRCASRQFDLILDDDDCCTFRGNIRCEFMAVNHGTLDAGEQDPGFCLSRIEDNVRHIRIQTYRPLVQYLIVQIFQ